MTRNPQGEILTTKRAAEAGMANTVESPGGKINPEETPELALTRDAPSLFDKLESQLSLIH
ncbi:NUDIX domain-containing protein, partial [Klebsiella pneumoniae]|uniref:NUDIX domain-containing protein n=1 Tax=Klebsiella pneumoniae TaxID=573 RepID=UPI00272F3E2A